MENSDVTPMVMRGGLVDTEFRTLTCDRSGAGYFCLCKGEYAIAVRGGASGSRVSTQYVARELRGSAQAHARPAYIRCVTGIVAIHVYRPSLDR